MEFTRPRGTRDFLFDEMRRRKKAESTLRNIFENYGYHKIWRRNCKPIIQL